jgi:hypothetical protein
VKSSPDHILPVQDSEGIETSDNDTKPQSHQLETTTEPNSTPDHRNRSHSQAVEVEKETTALFPPAEGQHETISSGILASTGAFGGYLANSVDQTVSTLGNIFYNLETRTGRKGSPGDKLPPKHSAVKKHSPAKENQTEETVNDGEGTQLESAENIDSVGKFSLQIINAFRYDVTDAAEGDHYITVEIDKEIKFTSQIMYNSATPIFNLSLNFQVPHYRAVIDINLMDAATGSKIGFFRFTPYEYMQREADRRYVWKLESSAKNYNKQIPIYQYDYYHNNIHDNKEIGYFSGKITFEEDNYHHYLSYYNVKYSPPSPEEELSMERLSIHISRFTEFFKFFTTLYEEYLYIMNWEEPILTLFLFVTFLYCTIQVSGEYSLSGVMFFILIMMTRALIRRRNGSYLRVYLSKGLVDVLPDYRPLAELKIGVLAFRLKAKSHASATAGSKSFGFLGGPSSAGDNTSSKPPVLKLSYLPLPETGCTTADKEQFIGFLGVSDSNFTTRGGMTQFMNSFLGSDNNKRYWQITNVVDIWKKNIDREILEKIGLKGCLPAGSADCYLIYKIPQPITAKLIVPTPETKDGVPQVQPKGTKISSESDEINAQNTVHSHDSEDDFISAVPLAAPSTDGISPFVSWSQNKSTIHISLRQEVGNNLVDSFHEHLKIPIKDIVTYGTPHSHDHRRATNYELIKWFKTTRTTTSAEKHQKDANNAHEGNTSFDNYDQVRKYSSGSQDSYTSSDPIINDTTELLLRISFTIPGERESFTPSDNEKFISQTFQSILYDQIDPQELSQASEAASSSSTTTFTVLWNMRDNIKYVQNLMNWILDTLESVKNLLNWTMPEKTFVLYFCVILIWFLTIFVPGRIIVLLIGLYEFLYIFLPIPDGNQITIIIMNILNSIPNDNDLINIYSNERKLYSEQKKKSRKTQFQETLLNFSLKSRWSGKVYLKWSTGSSINNETEWMKSLILIQGKRILWWKQDFENISANSEKDHRQNGESSKNLQSELPSTVKPLFANLI